MKIKLKFSLLPLFLLLLFQTRSYAATFTWTGNINSEWNNLNNWSGGIFLDLIPNADDDVIIPTGLTNYPVIGGSVTESIRILSMVVESGATVTVASQGTLRVFGPLGDGIDNAGTITNNGIIRIRDTGARGLDNNSGATFTNNGTLDIGTNSQPTQDNGIVNRGANTGFQNNGMINIEQVNASAISNESSASFLNANGATIDIGQNSGNISVDGISNAGNNTLFTNSGTMNIDNVSGNGVQNQSSATFSNTATANLNIGQTDGNIGGFGINSPATFTNSGAIDIDNTSESGLRNAADFNNAVNANINIGQNAGNIGDSGIDNPSTASSFTNSGIINIDNTFSNGISNQFGATFSNTATADLNIGQSDGNIGQDGIFNGGNSTTFNNRGTIKIDRVGNVGIGLDGSAIFLNEGGGIIEIGQDFVANTQGMGTGIYLVGSNTTFTNDNSLIQIDSTRTGENGITNQGTFSNQNSGKIEIGLKASIDSIGILNLGTFENLGDSIEIFDTGNDGINNQDTFNNAGTINLERIGDRGLDNNSEATFTNDGTLNIGTNNQPTEDNGIRNRGANTSFQNNGIINIENVNESAIRNASSASFLNANSASIDIGQNMGNISLSGIFNTNNNTVFTNSGTITIDNASDNGIQNQNGANFSNTANANINIGQNDGNISIAGIINTISGTTFENSGTINIDECSNSFTPSDGVVNQNGATFSNTATANLNIGQNTGNISGSGMINAFSNTIFTNSGTITIDNTGRTGIENQFGANFSNTVDANIEIGQNDGNIGLDGICNVADTPVFTNDGKIDIDDTSISGIRNEGDFNNAANATINIGQNDGKIGGNGIVNIFTDAIFDNSGTINIDNVALVDGIFNGDGANFNNAATANLNIGQEDGNIGQNGIFNLNGSATFTNNGTINIDNVVVNGINNLSPAIFGNSGTINIDDTTFGNGINNTGNFSNAANANLNIGQDDGNILSNGILNSNDSSTFTNSGTIKIDNTAEDGIQMQDGNFSNTSTANLDIGQNDGNISQNGILNLGSTIENNGTIQIDNTAEDGIQNRIGNFSNTATANLNIGQHDGNIGRNGILNQNGSSILTNSGTISIDNTSSNGITNQNGANFSNTAVANLNIGQNAGNIGDNGIYTEDGTTIFTNSGTIAIDQAAGNSIEIQDDSVFDNKGGSINIENSNNSSSSAIVLLNSSQFIDSTGTINLGQNQPFNGTAFEVGDGIFTGNDTTIIQCIGDFLIGTNGTVNGIGQLNLEGNWENNGTFTADSALVTILGDTQNSIGGDSTSIFFDLNISNSGSVVLENEVTVNNGLTLYEGKVNLGDNNFVLGNDYELSAQVGTSALVTNGTGEVISTVANGESRIFPVGNTNYTPITIQNNGTSDDFSVQCLPEVLEDGISGNAFTTNTVNTTWLIEEAVVGGTNATITAQWTSAEELLAFDRSNAFIARHTGTVWDGDVPTAASGSDPYTITRAGITTFSPFAVGSSFEGGLACVADDILLDNAPLASGMYSTKASIESSSTVTAGSIVEFFAVEVIELKPDFHAQSGSDFSARIDDCEFFFFNDETIEQRTDETNESIERNTLPLLFPNPVGQQLNIRDGIGQAVIYNMLGQEMQAFEIRDELHSLDVSSLVNGQYVLLILRDSGERVTLAFVK